MWLIFALGSLFFSGVVSILAKCSLRTMDSTVATAVRTTMVVRTAVATVESMVRRLHLARMDTTPEKKSDPSANISHIFTSHIQNQKYKDASMIPRSHKPGLTKDETPHKLPADSPRDQLRETPLLYRNRPP